MDLGLLGQFVVNGLMLGMMYALVAVGFTLFFGVLDVIQFSHGDVLMVGAFAGFATWLGLVALGVTSPWIQILAVVVIAAGLMALLGALIARYLVLPLKRAPALHTLLITLMLGTVLRENHAMLALARRLGFRSAASADDPEVVEVRLPLAAPAKA